MSIRAISGFKGDDGMKTTLFKSKNPSNCPNCGITNWLTQEETKKKVHCQVCYAHYDYEEMKK